MSRYILLMPFMAMSFNVYALYPPGGLTQNGHIPSALNSGGKIVGQITSQVASNVHLTRNISIGATAANAAMLRRMASPTGLLLTAAIAALGYYLDQNTGKLRTNPIDMPEGGGSCMQGSLPGVVTLQECYDNFRANVNSNAKGVYIPANQCHWHVHFGTPGQGAGLWSPQMCELHSQMDVATPAKDSTAAQRTAAREAQDAMTPRRMVTTDTGLADREVPEISNALDDMAQDYDAATDTNPDGSPNTSTQPDTDPATGDDGMGSATASPPPSTKTDEELAQETAGSGSGQTDCDKYPTAVGCLGLGDVPPPDEIQSIDVPVSLSPSSWGSGSCPGEISLPLSIGTKQFSLQPVCDFMTALYPVVIAISWLMAGFIVVGAVKD
jgi:hypothetical protein